MNEPHVNRILIVEDDENIAKFYAAALTCRLFICEVVSTAAEAMERLAGIGSPAFDGILADLVLSDSKSLELVKQFQELAPSIPVIVISGYDFDPADVIVAGAQDFLRKPVGSHDIRFAMSKAIARHQVRREYRPITTTIREIKEALDVTGRNIDQALRKPKSDPLVTAQKGT